MESKKKIWVIYQIMGRKVTVMEASSISGWQGTMMGILQINQSTVSEILKGVGIGDLGESHLLPCYSVNTQHLLQARDKIQGYIDPLKILQILNWVPFLQAYQFLTHLQTSRTWSISGEHMSNNSMPGLLVLTVTGNNAQENAHIHFQSFKLLFYL